jgi:hypothetical protein
LFYGLNSPRRACIQKKKSAGVRRLWQMIVARARDAHL